MNGLKRVLAMKDEDQNTNITPAPEVFCVCFNISLLQLSILCC